MNKKIFLKILLLVMIMILVLFIAFLISNKKQLTTETKIETELKEDYIYDDKGDESIFNVGKYNSYYSKFLEKNIIKMGLTVNNETDDPINMGIYLMKLVDNNKNNLGLCYTKGYNMYQEDDMFPSVVLAGTSKFGYLYCDVDNENFKYLKITYATKGYIDENDNYSYDTNDIFIELDN